MEITIEDIYGAKHILDTEKCREINFVHNKLMFKSDDSDANKMSHYVEYWPIQAYDSILIYITKEEFLKHVQ